MHMLLLAFVGVGALVPGPIVSRCRTPMRYAAGFDVGAGEDGIEGLVLSHDYVASAEFGGDFDGEDLEEINELLALRSLAKKDRNYKVADELREELASAFDVFVDDSSREWRVGAPPEAEAPARDLAFEATVPRSGGFVVEGEESLVAEYVRRGKKPLEAQRASYFALGTEAKQVWVRADGLDRDFFAGRVNAAPGTTHEDAFALQQDLVLWAATARRGAEAGGL